MNDTIQCRKEASEEAIEEAVDRPLSRWRKEAIEDAVVQHAVTIVSEHSTVRYFYATISKSSS